MSIKHFNTALAAGSGKSSSGSKSGGNYTGLIIGLAVVGLIAYGTYRYIQNQQPVSKPQDD